MKQEKTNSRKKQFGGWREMKLEEVAEIVGGGTPNTSVAEYWDGNISWITPKDLSNHKGRYISNGQRNISKIGLEKSSAKLLPKNTILLTTRAPVGYLGVADSETSTNQGFRSLTSNSETSSMFLFYLLKNNVEYLKSQSSGSTFGELSGSTLKSLKFLFPTLPEQKAIAEVLSSLDDKIDLLHRQNKTLEDMAQTLFRKWFVEDADEGWEVRKISDIADILSGFAFKSSSFAKNGEYRLITIKNVQNGCLDLSKTDHIEQIPEKMPGNCLLKKGDILLSLTGNVGRCCLVIGENLLLNQRVAKLQAKAQRDWAFTYILFRKISMRSMLEDMAKGTAQSNLSPIETADIEIKIPPSNIMQKISDVASPLLKKTLRNKYQICQTENLRNTLLPKLMSGKIRLN